MQLLKVQLLIAALMPGGAKWPLLTADTVKRSALQWQHWSEEACMGMGGWGTC